MASNNIEWGRTNEQIEQEWNEMFQSIISELNEEWIVHYHNTDNTKKIPDIDKYLDSILEPIKITFKCLECAHIWTSRKGVVVLNFRRSLTSNEPSKMAGEVLIFPHNQPCRKCSTIKTEKMFELLGMNKVLNCLKEEIGWRYHQSHFKRSVPTFYELCVGNDPSKANIPDDESLINRPAVEFVNKVQKKKQQKYNLREPRASDTSSSDRAKSAGEAKQVKKQNIPHGRKEKGSVGSMAVPVMATMAVPVMATMASSVKNTNDRDKTSGNSNQFSFYNHSYYNSAHKISAYKQPKKEVEPLIAQPPIVAAPQRNLEKINKGGESGKKTSRRNKFSKEIQEQYWLPIFDNMFQKFITRSEPDDKWVLTLGKVPKVPIRELVKRKRLMGIPLNRDELEKLRVANLQTMSFNYNVLISYLCSMCRNIWKSYLPYVSIHILQNNRQGTEWKRKGGHIIIEIKTGQKCKKCPAQNEKYYENGDFVKGQIEMIITEVLNRIEIKFYDKKADKKESLLEQRDLEAKKPHESTLCENCANGDCRYSQDGKTLYNKSYYWSRKN